ncbi:hypothetical protein [Leisingera methylohalidivorans]|uniref:hypothetical protein n=1 Tax=Leisingera methylohalidivorans TaxID=133924 RepID=UPI0012EB89D2|nr:hypothetical protein [Leisingera methylohalidivorans]
MFFIDFNRMVAKGIEPRRGYFRIDDTELKFESCVSTLKSQEYVENWVRSLRKVVFDRFESCVLYSLELDETGNGMAWYYGALPSEAARGAETYQVNSGGVFFTEGFFNVTTNLEVFDSFCRGDYERSGFDRGVALHFLNGGNLEVLDNHVTDSISNISSWYCENSLIVDFLSFCEGGR